MIIENTQENIVVLKAYGHPDIRLFPGFNDVDIDNSEKFDQYFNNKAAKGLTEPYEKMNTIYSKKDPNSDKINNTKISYEKIIVKPTIKIVNDENLLTEDDKIQANDAKEKNDRLNKGAKLVKHKDNKTSDQEDIIKLQQQRINELEAIVSEAQKQSKKSKSNSK